MAGIIANLDEVLEPPLGGMAAMHGDPSLYTKGDPDFITHHTYFTSPDEKPSGTGDKYKYWLIDSDSKPRYFTPEINAELDKAITGHITGHEKWIRIPFLEKGFTYRVIPPNPPEVTFTNTNKTYKIGRSK
jgi:hypothetical protein